jgi:hypothetical protein
MSLYANLCKQGLSNTLFDYREITSSAKFYLVAYCDSDKCYGKRNGIGIQKRVPNGRRECPDCGRALFWERKRVEE